MLFGGPTYPGDFGSGNIFYNPQQVFLREKVKINFDLILSDSIIPHSEIILEISQGQKSLVTVIADRDSVTGLTIITLAGDSVIKRRIESVMQTDTLFRVEAEINASPGSFTLSSAGMASVQAKISFISGRKYWVSILNGRSLASATNDNQGFHASNPFITGSQGSGKPYTEILFLILLVVADIAFFIIIHLRNRYQKMKGLQQSEPVSIANVRISEKALAKKSAIHLFGGLEIYTRDGEEISSEFSPILKELFILLICRKPEEGISSAALKEILWYDKSDESARNNRSVYLAKLRQILEKVGDSQLNHDKGKWVLNFPGIYVDYLDYRSIIGKKIINIEDIENLSALLIKGSFLPECDYLWLDVVKSEIADYAITLLTDFSDRMDKERNTELINSIADALFTVDPLNDTALSLKCRYYNLMGKPYLSKQVYTNFTKEYKNTYGEEFNRTYSDILSD
jgi:DNA-binding SARP family transcriptional activator